MGSAQPLIGELNNSPNTDKDQSRQPQDAGKETNFTDWKDLPMELLLRIISLVGDDRIVIVASGVCTGWRDTLGWGVASLSLSW